MAYSGQIVNQSFEEWQSAILPEDMQTRVANTTISRLERDQQYDRYGSPGVEAIDRVMDISGSRVAAGPLVYDGLSALRATITATENADDFRIWGPGAIVVALTGASTNQLSVSPGERMIFSVMARCNTPGNLLRLRIFFRDVADAVLGAVDTNGFVQNTAQNVPLAMSDTWKKLAIRWVQPASIDGVRIEHAVWQLSTGTAGAQVIDLDDLHYGGQFESEEG